MSGKQKLESLEGAFSEKHSEELRHRRRPSIIFLDRQRILGDWLFIILCMIAIDTDTSFLRMPEINEDKKCIQLNKYLRTAAIIWRSVFDFLYIIYRLYPVLVDKEARKSQSLVYLFLVDIIAILPIPQVLVICHAAKFVFAVNFLYGQLVIRIIRMYPLFRKRELRNWVEQILFSFVVFLYSFIEASGIIGSLWYFLAVKREAACWKKALMNKKVKWSPALVYCDEGLGNYTFLNSSCPTKTEDKTIYDFGIFIDALQSGIVDAKNGNNFANSMRKATYCWRWGLQSISGFGQGLQTSTNIGENIFVLSITLVGVMLLIVSIGLFQLVIQNIIAKVMVMISKTQELEQWKPFEKFPEELQLRVKKAAPQKMKETAGVDVENLLNCDISEQLKKEIKHYLCRPLLVKVDDFRHLSNTLLEKLCDRAKPVTYAARTHIVRMGDPVNEMIFVVDGELWAYKANGTETNTGPDHFLNDGDFCGKELLDWLPKRSSLNLPTSNKAIQTLTKVEAFALVAHDLRNVFDEQMSPTQEAPIESQPVGQRQQKSGKGWFPTLIKYLFPARSFRQMFGSVR